MTREHAADWSGEEGYLLIGLVVVCFLLLLALSVAAPRVAKELERDREVESEHRGLEYVRAIQLYYRKNGSYPTSVEQLLGSGTTGAAVAGPGSVKYLRQAYKDPLTRAEFRLIHVNEAQTEVKGFFGEPLPGMPAGLGAGMGGTSSAAAAMGGSTPGMAVNAPSSGASGAGASGAPGGFSMATSSFGSQSGAAGSTAATGTTGATGTSTAGTASSSSSTDATSFGGSKGAFIGVGSNSSGKGLVEWNGSEDIAQWEFLYDPRVEQLKAKVSILGGAPAASGSGSIGSGFAPISGTSTPGTSLAPTMGSGTSGTSTGTTMGSGTTGTSTGSSTPTQ